jgi:hypothetical protein
MILGLLTAGLAVCVGGLSIELANYRKLVKSLRNTIADLEGTCEHRELVIKQSSAHYEKRITMLKQDVAKLEQENISGNVTKALCNKLEEQLRALLEEPTGFAIVENFGAYKVYAKHGGDSAVTLIKVFNTDDPDYNLGLAEELKEKLEEKI